MDGPTKIFVCALFLPVLIPIWLVWGIVILVRYLIRQSNETREQELLAAAEAERNRPAQPVVLNMPVSSRNTLYGSQQSDD